LHFPLNSIRHLFSMVGYSSQQAQRWDPDSAFGIGNPDRWGAFTCVGWAPTQRRRCRNPIAGHNQDAAWEILDELSSMRPLEVSETQTDKLKEAAGYALCRRYHQDQVDMVVRKWKRILREEVSGQPERRRDESSEERSTSRNHRRSVSHGDSVRAPPFASSSTLSSTRSRSGSQELRQRNSRHNGMNRLGYVSDDVNEILRRMASILEAMSEQLRQAHSAPAVVEEEQQSSRARTPEPQQSPQARTLEPQQQSVAVPESEPAHRQTCTARHKSRRSVDEDCVICTMPMVNCSLSELVWCKSSCGRSVHRDCFETMRGYVDVIRCVIWLVSLFFVCLVDLHCWHTLCEERR